MTRTITVTGMSCDHCEQTVSSALEAVDGIESASADHGEDVAVVEGDAPVEVLIEAVEDAGYEASA